MVETEITKSDLHRRIRDWKERISALYDMIAEWLRSEGEYRCKRRPRAHMYEELMDRFSVRPQTLEELDVYRGDDLVATVKPVGLWVIGANGRLDILTKDGATILVDKAEKFRKPQWVAYGHSNGKEGHRFDKHYFVRLIEE